MAHSPGDASLNPDDRLHLGCRPDPYTHPPRMAAALIPAIAPEQLHLLRLPEGDGVASVLEEVDQSLRHP